MTIASQYELASKISQEEIYNMNYQSIHLEDNNYFSDCEIIMKQYIIFEDNSQIREIRLMNILIKQEAYYEFFENFRKKQDLKDIFTEDFFEQLQRIGKKNSKDSKYFIKLWRNNNIRES
ncbi:unnamed protein product [Paramecium pentaurelia]|uniref:Uncharacterized protein n=1 Tax=Paramecium pentaurelia TaxID=43138 RepID=A0A8S1WW49_9CILI|nr:unnamed protein product [Paramecium pentaurelia]